MGDNEVDELEDDGMEGSLGAGPEDGGIITPYSFQPAPASVGGTPVSGQLPQHQLEPQMRQILNAALAADGVGAGLAAGYRNEKRARLYVLRTSSASSNPNEQDPFVLSPSSGGGNANDLETESIGEDILNLYLLAQRHLLTRSPTAVPSQLPRTSTAIVVHEDGGRVVLRFVEEGEEEREELDTELPPTYHSLPHDVRKDTSS